MRRASSAFPPLVEALIALLFLAAGCEQGHEQKFWTVEGYVRDLSGSPIEEATVGVDIDRPALECCPWPGFCLCGYERDFSETTDVNGHFLVCLEAADVRTTLLVEKPGYSAPRPYADFERTEGSEAVETCDFWFHGGAFHTIEGHIRNPDGSLSTEYGSRLTLSDTEGRWEDPEWPDSGHYAFRAPDCDLTFEVEGPLGCTGAPQVKRYEGVHSDYSSQDFIAGCPGLEAVEYEVYSALIQQELLDHDGPKMMQDLAVVRDRTRPYGPDDGPATIYGVVQASLPGVSDDMAADYVARNADTYALEPRFAPGLLVDFLSEDEWDDIVGRVDGWEAFLQRHPGATAASSISRVGFNASADKALLYFDSYCGWVCGSGYYCLLVKAQGLWKVEAKMLAWQS